MKSVSSLLNVFILLFLNVFLLNCEEFCSVDNKDSPECSDNLLKHDLFAKEVNRDWSTYLEKINKAVASYKPCVQKNCSCHLSVIKQDLANFKSGISKEMIESARKKGTKYQIIDHRLYRDKECMFPARCSGVEHFIVPLLAKLPDMELMINTRDWPQASKHFGDKSPVFSFSKTDQYNDVLYPAWGFWEGGPAIKLHPRGLGRWDLHRETVSAAADKWPWAEKKPIAFFRGSRTSGERDALVRLAQERPDLADARYTKNQAWKSDADTLDLPPATEVSLEDHCQYRYLFNFRGVAASFRLKHLFLCRSLVFHVGNKWLEFFYPAMKPWVHYIPVESTATKEDIKELIEFASQNQAVAQEMADRGYEYIRDHLRMTDVECYWKKLLLRYAKLLSYKPELDKTLVEIK